MVVSPLGTWWMYVVLLLSKAFGSLPTKRTTSAVPQEERERASSNSIYTSSTRLSTNLYQKRQYPQGKGLEQLSIKRKRSEDQK